MKLLVVFLSFMLLCNAAESRQNDPSFAQIIVTSKSYAKAKNICDKSNSGIPLQEIARQTMYRHFGKNPANIKDGNFAKQNIIDWAKTLKVEQKFQNPAGVFVTLSTDGKTRACWGSVYPREANVTRETVLATLGALTKEYRFKPIKPAELADLKVQVTVVRAMEPVNNIKEINPFKDGIMVRCGGKGGVILPGEAVDAHYELVLARLKAGIQPNEPCQIYKIRAEIYD